MTPTDSTTGTATDSSNGTIPTLTLNNDNVIPVIGLGVAELSEDDTERAVAAALEAGYRLIDTASVYGNEAAVGRAIAASGVPREELFITTKLANRDQGYSTTRTSLATSLEKLGLDYVDMYMIHWPAAHLGLYVDSYGMMQVLESQGLLRSIGVCNFLDQHLTPISELTYTNPAVNQIELHPLLNQAEMRQNHANREMVTQAYSPLGVGAVLDNPTLIAIGEKYGKSPAQVAIRWSIQLGNVVIPRSGNPARIAENIDVFDFELSDEDMAAINGLDNGTRFRPDPATYTGD